MADKPWLRVWPRGVPVSIPHPRIPLHKILEETAERHPQKSAITYLEREITYGKLNSLSDQFAAGLQTLGVKRGDRVAIFLPNIPQFIFGYYGTIKAGAVLTAISPLHRDREVKYQLKDSEAETILTLDTLYPIVDRIKQTTKLKNVILTGKEKYEPELPSSTLDKTAGPRIVPLPELLNKNTIESPVANVNPKETLVALQYTGGTTGRAKGAMLTHTNLVSNTLMFATWIKGTQAKEVFLVVLPLFHIYGMTTSMNVPIKLAAKMILLPRFDQKKVFESIQNHKVTIFCGVPTMYTALVSNPEISKFNLSSIRVCISGASPLPPEIQRKFMKATGGLLVEGYGLTEASPVTHCHPVEKTMETVVAGSIGIPLPDTDARICDTETGQVVLRTGETGEIAVKGPQIMKGYWRKPEETSNILRDGWLYTGDIGRMDKKGYFYITDRKKDLIKYKDYSVYPRELEDVLYEHPSVKLCAVIGKPDPESGEIPKAFITLKEGAKPSESQIIRFIRDRVAPYKAVREVEFRQSLPLSSVGKVLRRVLKEEEIGKKLCS